MAIAKEQLRQIIAENDINGVSDIYALFKNSLMNRELWSPIINEAVILLKQ